MVVAAIEIVFIPVHMLKCRENGYFSAIFTAFFFCCFRYLCVSVLAWELLQLSKSYLNAQGSEFELLCSLLELCFYKKGSRSTLPLPCCRLDVECVDDYMHSSHHCLVCAEILYRPLSCVIFLHYFAFDLVLLVVLT